MAEIDEKVMAFVEETLKKSPRIKLGELFERAKEVDPSVSQLNKRQFNARYPLQVKRRKAQGSVTKADGGRKAARKPRVAAKGKKEPRQPRPRIRGRAPRKAVAAAAPRDAVRSVFLQFATDIAGADERKDLVRVLANVDRYVEQVLKAAGGS